MVLSVLPISPEGVKSDVELMTQVRLQILQDCITFFPIDSEDLGNLKDPRVNMKEGFSYVAPLL